MDYICGEQKDQEFYPSGTESSCHCTRCISPEITVKPVDLNPSDITRTENTSTPVFGKNLFFPVLSPSAPLQPTTILHFTPLSKVTLAVLFKCVGDAYAHCDHDLASPRTRSVVPFRTDEWVEMRERSQNTVPKAIWIFGYVGISPYLTNVASHFRRLACKTQTPCLLHMARL